MIEVPHRPNTHRHYRCQCNRPVFFDNSACLACGTPLGYVVETGEVTPLVSESAPDSWRRYAEDTNDAALYYRCANFDSAAGCNWMISASDRAAEKKFCVACRLNRTIPDLSTADNAALWRRVELAKRRLVSSLLALGLPVRARCDEDPDQGVMFDFLRAPIDGAAVMTGHINGLITLNIEEADDAKREKVRIAMHEPYRTLLGHLRHEIGHYYWDRLVAGTRWLADFRELFGDESRDYATSLQQQYQSGPPEDWQQHYVSSYAASHPWEDWAETWAHYLHMMDALETAWSFGMHVDATVPLVGKSGNPGDPYEEKVFDRLIQRWLPLCFALNSLNRSMGHADFYPFILSADVVEKLRFIHGVCHGGA